MGEGEKRDCYYAKCLNELRKFADAFASPIFHTKQGRTKNMEKHRWTAEENYDFCVEYIYAYIIYREDLTLTEMAQRMQDLHPHLKRSSIEKKLKNIRFLSIERELDDSATFSPLYGYSTQCWVCFEDALSNLQVV
jgi:hypothetical protein